jgi:hypothetical protein
LRASSEPPHNDNPSRHGRLSGGGMSTDLLARALKDEDYRLGLAPEDVPTHPSGVPEDEIYVTSPLNDSKISNGQCNDTCDHICSA